jgi:hypothetical protein
MQNLRVCIYLHGKAVKRISVTLDLISMQRSVDYRDVNPATTLQNPELLDENFVCSFFG